VSTDLIIGSNTTLKQFQVNFSPAVWQVGKRTSLSKDLMMINSFWLP